MEPKEQGVEEEGKEGYLTARDMESNKNFSLEGELFNVSNGRRWWLLLLFVAATKELKQTNRRNVKRQSPEIIILLKLNS